MKDKREPILVFKGKDINLVIDALENMTQFEVDTPKLCKDYSKLYSKIKEVMRIE